MPLKGTAKSVPVVIVPIDVKAIRYWQRHIQPLVNRHYRLASDTTDIERRIRADVGWNWWLNASYALAHNLAVRSSAVSHSPACGWAMVLTLPDKRHVPVGLLTAVPDFLCRVAGSTNGRGFAWY
jgi:hypothetical protein